MPAKQIKISVESLRPVTMLCEGDIYDLACLLLKLWDARDREKNSRNTGSVVRSRPTVGYLATSYSQLMHDVAAERVREVLLRHGLPLGAVVDDDDAVRKVAPAGLRPGDGTARRRGRRKPPGE